MPFLNDSIFKRINLNRAIFGSGNRQQGIAIIWIVVIMVAISSAGAAMLRLYSTSTAGWLDANASGESKAMADSGYRFLLKEYQLQPNDKKKNELLDELNNKSFQFSTGSDGQFKLDVSSYFYRVEADPAGAASLRLKFVGQGGFTVPATGFLKLDLDDTVYEYTSQTEAGGVYTFSTTQGVSPAAVYTTVRPVVQASINAVSQGGTLTLGSVGSGLGAVFPDENGMFLIEKEKIKASLPVKTTIPYRYEYRSGDQLVNVQKGPDQSGFNDIESDSSAAVELAKLLTVESIGTYGDTASKTNTYQLSMDHGSFTSGLKNYWSFDNVPGIDVADNYGNSPGELAGGTLPILVAGKVGPSALYFSGAGSVSTSFTPGSAIGAGRPFTLVFWAKPDVVYEGVLRVALGSYESGALTKYFFIGTFEGRWVWGLGNDAQYYDLPGLPLPDVRDDSDLQNIGNWQHVAYVYDGNNIFMYINGIKEYEFLGFGITASLPNLGISLGGLNTSGGTGFNFLGTLDEIAIFDTALNICEIREIYEVPCNTGCGVFNSDNQDLTKIPVMYLPFNGNGTDESGVNKDGPYNNDATPVGATLTPDRFGCPDKAYSLEGGNYYLTVAHSPSLDMGDIVGVTEKRVTVSAWVKKASNQSGNIAVVQKSDFSYILRFDDDYASFIIDAADGGKIWAWMRTPLPAGEWYHLVGTYDRVNVRIYVDGIPEDVTPFNGDIGDDSDRDLWIGENIDKRGRYLDGKIDDVAVWNRALTDKQVKAYYKATSHK